MLRGVQLLSFLAVAANLVLLADLVRHAAPVWRTAMVAGAAACVLVALALSIKRPSTASSHPLPSLLLISPAASNSTVDGEAPVEKVSGDPLQNADSTLELSHTRIPASTVGDDPLQNKPWLNLVEECVDLYDELDRLQPSLDASAQELADHCRCRLLEILERSGVSILAENATFDRGRHQAESARESPPEGTPIEATLSPGFAVGRRVFRRARVKLAESLLPTQEPSP
ncbi:MAG: hypothetical protein ACYC3I_14660 [Gemmataceae bacterium]